MRRALRTLTLGVLGTLAFGSFSLAQSNVRLSNDFPGGGYTSVYTLATGNAYTDAVLNECSRSRGRQNEPAIGVDPRNTNVLVGSSNDYCGVYLDINGVPQPVGPIWLGYYRSQNGGASFQSSLVPGYPGDTSPYAALANIRTASAGDPVIAWDGHGRLFMGSESSDDPAGSKKSFGDEWVARFDNPDGEGGNTINDGKRFLGSTIVQRGTSAPNLLGRFQDKTALEADRTGGRCDANVYFAFSSFNGNAPNNQIYFARSTDHGATWTHPTKLSESVHGVQDADIAITGNGNVYVTYRQFASQSGQPDAIVYNKSTDCGATFSKPITLLTFIPYDAQDIAAPAPIPIPTSSIDDPLGERDTAAAGALARDCGDFADACQSGYTFFRHTTTPRSTADQYDAAHEYVYIVYDPTKPGTTVSTGTSYGSITPGTGSQEGVYFTRLDGATGANTTPVLLEPESTGHQLFPDISADKGVLHVLWWDSRNDPAYSPARPIGNDANGHTTASLDVFAKNSVDLGATWSGSTRLTDVTSNPNYEQFDNREVPFAGDYLYITSLGNFSYGTWTDWRATVPGTDPRENGDADHNDAADVKQCRTFNSVTGAWSGDTCPRDGGLDQNIFGGVTP